MLPINGFVWIQDNIKPTQKTSTSPTFSTGSSTPNIFYDKSRENRKRKKNKIKPRENMDFSWNEGYL